MSVDPVQDRELLGCELFKQALMLVIESRNLRVRQGRSDASTGSNPSAPLLAREWNLLIEDEHAAQLKLAGGPARKQGDFAGPACGAPFRIVLEDELF